MKLFGAFLCAIAIPTQFIYAQIEITEIMYDLEGSDAKREWVEVFNNGSVSIDLTDWRFNDGKNHTFPEPELIPPESFAILVSDKNTFLAENTVSVPVIDTVMSLNNTIDTLSLINAEGVEVSSITYDSALGASGDGHSLQVINGNVVPAIPTPGEQNSNEQFETETEQEETSNSSSESAPTAPSVAETDPYVNPSIKAYAGNDKTVLSGGLVFFEGKGTGLKGEALINARYVWNFGDGSTKEGIHVSHSYVYPGTYPVMLNVTSGKFVKSDQVIVTVEEPNLELHLEADRVEIKNKAKQDADISYWVLQNGKHKFSFPKDTMLLSQNTHIFTHEITGFSSTTNQLTLSYPNGKSLLEVSHLETLDVPRLALNIGKTLEKEVVVVEKVVEKIVEIPVTGLPEPKSENARGPALDIGGLEETVSATAVASDSNYRWYVMLVSIIAVASLIVLSRKKKKPESGLDADDIAILD